MIGVVVICDGCGEECNDEPSMHSMERGGSARSYCLQCTQKVRALFAPRREKRGPWHKDNVQQEQAFQSRRR